MATLDELLHSIENSPEGPQVLAIFDFDGTLISGYSAVDLVREQFRRGDLSPAQLFELITAMASFSLGSMGFSAMMNVGAQFLQDIEETTYQGVSRKLYREHIARRVYPESRALVQAHLARGHTVAVISSATPYQVLPAARDLGIEHVLCTDLEVEDGRFTGSVVRPTCFGQGKVRAAEGLAKRFKARLSDAFFYSDSTDDLDLLEVVGKPVALNPSDRLARVAQEQQWPEAHFGSRGRPSVSQMARSVAATSSMVGSFIAGLPIYALTGSRRESINFSVATFGELASALIGMRLRVKGEEHLWSSRPCVFIFNHQSKADVIILARLLRRDFASVGKQEIKTESPLLGKVMEYTGTIFIDRSDARSAIKSVNSLVEVMHAENKSVVMAPEGTRTVSPTLATFKKGAFHIAMQAKVPIVPIVIRNAGDVAPRGEFVYRPATVDVEILPPVETADWRRADLDEHIREVRNMYLRCLGQPEEAAPASDSTAEAAKDQAAVKPAAKTAAKKAAAKAAPAKKAAPKRKSATKKAPAKAAGKAKAKAKAKAKSRAKTPATDRPASQEAARSAPKARSTAGRPSTRPKARPKRKAAES
ncbi:HAD-IB family hydrolase [Mangrovimicrobium sediminis]|uniref:1-acyl-sn-glycerol-3-phosphate acyltransferase n=2 Tax=Mangrovimicrobium sediminis TaxID=2562682 RepID=A0A4Z0LXR9_9GAMM|nr:HAD-IB family hydrolase [Haliea sp. SAOS-164]